jgi:hypothetical protein
MENKRSIVRTAIFQKSLSSEKYGDSHIFEITFDNGDKGQYFSKTKDQNLFQEGKESDYTIEQKVNGQYTNYAIKPVKQQQNGFGGFKANPVHENKRTALKCAVELAGAGKIETTKISDYATSFMKFLND